ncbi:MAG: asparagine synthase C-terminal domain-containing protein [Thermoplasmata archaeon]|jgi:asparagine synthase (glutamine-hydrolysing)|nr:asparagine synthase C-terminal domain-containing protein [Thermoplasmata archaeon]
MPYFDIADIHYEDILHNLLMNNIPRIREKKVSVLLSGGLDSTIILALVKEHYDVIAYTTGIEGSKDINNAREVAKKFDVEHQPIIIGRDMVLNALWRLINKYTDLSVVELSFEIPFYIGVSRVRERNIFTGQGADELFGGYNKYLKNPSLMERDIILLIGRTVPREMEIARSFNKSLHMPFISPGILKFAMDIPLDEKVGEERKIILRKLASRLGLPRDVMEREKIAMQYGTGVMKLLRKIAKSNNLTLKELTDREKIKKLLYNEAII